MKKRVRKVNEVEFMVEFDFLTDGRPMQLRTFKKEREAREFAGEVGGNVVAVIIRK